jgi:serine/threonine protein kinase
MLSIEANENVVSTAARIFCRFPRLQELRHPNLAPYIDLYKIKGRALLLSYHKNTTLSSLLDGLPATLTEWGQELFGGEACVNLRLDKQRQLAPHKHVPEKGASESRRLSEEAAMFVCLEVGRAIEYLHVQGLVHGRITPQCILLGDAKSGGKRVLSQVLLSDYGAQYLTNKQTDDVLTDLEMFPTLDFCAPEVIAAQLLKVKRNKNKAPLHGEQYSAALPREQEPRHVDASADVWSLGAVVLYALSTCTPRLPWSCLPLSDLPLSDLPFSDSSHSPHHRTHAQQHHQQGTQEGRRREERRPGEDVCLEERRRREEVCLAILAYAGLTHGAENKCPAAAAAAAGGPRCDTRATGSSFHSFWRRFVADRHGGGQVSAVP